MSKFVLIVDLEIKPESIDTFIEAAKEQAEQSVRLEPGCHRFDIVSQLEEPHKLTHYEIFEDLGAFEAHTKMPHTASFSEKIGSLIVGVTMRRGILVASVSK